MRGRGTQALGAGRSAPPAASPNLERGALNVGGQSVQAQAGRSVRGTMVAILLRRLARPADTVLVL